MKKITAKEIKKIALLADIKLSEKVAEKLVDSVRNIIVHMEALKRLPLDNIAETTQVTEDVNRGREDFVKASLPRKVVVKNGKVYKGYFIFDRILHRNDI